ncbi:MAG: hypothetical protein QME51_11835, partial [Planctomycetota bacterium]|nr:hypothetical protein [Planctomycetota bacterium]
EGMVLSDPLFAERDDKLKQQVKYLFALILLRKKLLRLKESFIKQGVKFLILERVSDNRPYEVLEVSISDNEFIALRDEFSKLFEFRI